MLVRKIYVDMDGVLADFDRGVREYCGMEPSPQAESLTGRDALMWDRIRQVDRFYDRLEPMPGAKAFLRELLKRYGSRCEILTGIPKPAKGMPTSGEDKTRWMRRCLSEDIPMNIVYREQKPRFCQGPQDVLIDDFEENIREWEAAGGTGVLHTDPEETLRRLEELEKETAPLIGMPNQLTEEAAPERASDKKRAYLG